MSNYNYSYNNIIDLFVKGRISESDAKRQAITAKAILERMKDQPGLILADEVGMGKTFVALAVAISIYLKEKKPVVIMIPPNLIKKWPNDFRLFKESCIQDPKIREELRCSTAEKPEEFLKYLDDAPDKISSIIFLTHGALARKMGDGFIKLAIIQKALYMRKDTSELYKSLAKYAGNIINRLFIENKNKNVAIWELLLNSNVNKWKNILVKNKFFKEDDDDPVSELFNQELQQIKTSELNTLYWQLREQMPKRESSNIEERLGNVRQILNTEAKTIWTRCLKRIKLELPLLIFDEAHHLKNSQTQLVTKLFHNPEAEEDAGILTGQFERMLFLTATPFQLGHQELCRVLERFETINWNSNAPPSIDSIQYKEELKNLLKFLDDSQLATRRLDNSWGKLEMDDMVVNDIRYKETIDWWREMHVEAAVFSTNSQNVKENYSIAKEKLKAVEALLRKYVIRHLKPKVMSDQYAGIKRRNNLPGKQIQFPDAPERASIGGLDISNGAMLPFLLAARLTTIQQNKRPVFAEGLASSFEAFRDTRSERLKKIQGNITDTDDDVEDDEDIQDEISIWYLNQLNDSLISASRDGSLHPKIHPTVRKAIGLWLQNEKVLIFCHYIATGKALRKYISAALADYIRQAGSKILDCNEAEVFDRLDKIANDINDPESIAGKKVNFLINQLIDNFPELNEFREEIIKSLLNYLRTPSFLIRFAPLGTIGADDSWIEKAFGTEDNSGIAFKNMIWDFLEFLENRKEDRVDYLAALKSIQPSGIRVKDITQDFNMDDIEQDSDIIMPNIRLCYGKTKQETRQKLMKAFNSPFFPDILITSSVMAEGVDLHLSCRQIIHHDLCWNPSTLEQRTGRVDRIGSKSEKCGKPIEVYLPYISETQDEKMYRVVMERERWFNIVMGDKYKVDAVNTDKYAERISLPEELSRELSFNLEINEKE